MSPKIGNVEEQYTKDPQLKKDDIVLLQNWLEKQPHLPPVSEMELINFLHSCYYSLEQAKQTIDTFFSIRTKFPNVFGKQDANAFKTAINQAIHCPLQNLTQEGYLIMITKLMNNNPKTFSVECHIQYSFYSLFIQLLEKGPYEGIIILIDIDGTTWEHIIRIPLPVMKASFHYLQEALPVRLIQIHFINSAPFIDKFLSIIKPYLKVDLLSKIFTHTKNLETLYPYVPLRCLPSNYGGSDMSLDELHSTTFFKALEHRLIKNFLENVKDLMLQNMKFIEDDELRRSNENKRQGKTINTNILDGMEGSFKKLEID